MSEQSSVAAISHVQKPWQFQPGQSGNPLGRPKQAVDIAAICREHGPKAAAVLAKLLDSEDERIALAAANAVLDRGYGKPLQAIASDDTAATLTFLHLTAMRAWSDEQARRREIDGTSTNVDTHTTVSTPRNLMEPATE